jgi:hypothetical protein
LAAKRALGHGCRVEDEVHLPGVDGHRQRVQRIVRPSSRPEAVAEPEEVLLVDRFEHRGRRPLDDLVLQRRDCQRPLPAVRLRDIDPPRRQRPVGAPMDTVPQISEVSLKVCGVVLPRHAVHAGRRLALDCSERLPEQIVVDVVQERGEPLVLPFPGCGPHALERL